MSSIGPSPNSLTPLDNDPLARGAVALLVVVLTSVIPFVGLIVGERLIPTSSVRGHQFGDTNASFANWDGQWYTRIATHGYEFNPGSMDANARSSPAWFPAYPLIGRGVARLTGLDIPNALLLTSNLFLAAAFVVVAQWLHARDSQHANPQNSNARSHAYALAALGLIPTSFFFRMAYTEAMFLFLTALTLLAIQRKCNPVVIAIVVGLATATRPVGVALAVGFVWHLAAHAPNRRVLALRLLTLGPLACWGLLAYMAYLAIDFGDPLAFVKAQDPFKQRTGTPVLERLLALVTLEPIRSFYDSRSPLMGWGVPSSTSLAWLFSLRPVDSVVFLAFLGLIVLGGFKRWLNGVELVISAGLLAIPYASIGYEQYMQSMARYSSAVLPAYLVMGRLLAGIPAPLVMALAGISGFFLGLYAALFAAWYTFI